MRPVSLALLAAAALAAACNTGFSPQYLVKDLRILGISSTAQGTAFADVKPGDVVDLEVLVAMAPPGLVVSWLGCAPPTSELATPCEEILSFADPVGLVASPDVELLGTCAPSALDGTCGISATVDPVAATSALKFQQGQPSFECRPYVEMTVVAIATGAGKAATAMKRVRIVPADATARNENPVPVGIERGATDLDHCTGGLSIDATPYPAGRVTLCSPTTSAPQTFQQCNPTLQSTVESFSWQWFVTAGNFPDDNGGIGNATGDRIDFDRSSGAFSMWTIMRDGRGGVGWLRKDVAALP